MTTMNNKSECIDQNIHRFYQNALVFVIQLCVKILTKIAQIQILDLSFSYKSVMQTTDMCLPHF